MDENALALMRREHIGIVFQFFNLLEGMTVLENVVMPAVIAGRKRRSAETRARDLLDLLGIGDKAKQAPSVLSGGQRQRLAIARALLLEPPILLLDDPTTAIDPETEAEVLSAMDQAMQGRSTIVVANRLSTLRRAHEILVFDDGRIVERGTHEELMELHGVYFRAASLQAADNESRRLLGSIGVCA
jgi:ABC-type multidrug transport system fused ATPase/permease subunit